MNLLGHRRTRGCRQAIADGLRETNLTLGESAADGQRLIDVNLLAVRAGIDGDNRSRQRRIDRLLDRRKRRRPAVDMRRQQPPANLAVTK